MKKYPMKRTMTHKQSIQGATLVEVLVSVFLLTFGILGLMAAQLNSVAAVSESENRAIAAQAAENLAEAMQANPDIAAKGERKYDKYLQTSWADVAAIATCSGTSSASGKEACALAGKTDITKSELAAAQLGEFQFVLSQMPNTVNLKYAICLDNVAGLTAEAANPILTDAQCSGSGQLVIKVLWTSRGSAKNAAKEAQTGIPDTDGNKQLYYLVLAN